MGRRPGSTNSEEHNQHIAESIHNRYDDDPGYALTLSQKARERWNREYQDEVEAFLAEFESGSIQRRLLIGLRAMARTLNDGQHLDDPQKQLLRAARDLRKVSSIYNAASTPYVGDTQTRHAPMTGRHTHDHAAFGATDHDDGVHGHPHDHNGDADHDHADQHGRIGTSARASASSFRGPRAQAERNADPYGHH